MLREEFSVTIRLITCLSAPAQSPPSWPHICNQTTCISADVVPPHVMAPRTQTNKSLTGYPPRVGRYSARP